VAINRASRIEVMIGRVLAGTPGRELQSSSLDHEGHVF
jgi:hypothetical protein